MSPPSKTSTSSSPSSQSPPVTTPTQTQQQQHNIEETSELSITPVSVLVLSSIPLLTGAYFGYRFEMKRSSDALARGTNNPTGVGTASANQNSMFYKLMVQNHESNNPNNNTATAALKNKKSASAVISKSSPISPKKNPVTTAGVTTIQPPGPQYYLKALGYGTLLSLGGFSLLTSIVFYWTDSNSINDLLHKTKTQYAPNFRRNIHTFLGLTEKEHEEKITLLNEVEKTKGMSEDEEWEYVKKNYLADVETDDKDQCDDGK